MDFPPFLTSANISRTSKMAADRSRDKIYTIASLGIMAYIVRKRYQSRPKPKRELWTHEWLLERKDLGAHHALLKTLKDEDPKKYRNFIRMDEAQFCHLLSLVEPHITRKTTNMRAPIPAGERL